MFVCKKAGEICSDNCKCPDMCSRCSLLHQIYFGSYSCCSSLRSTFLRKMTIVNAWILHSQLTGSKISHTVLGVASARRSAAIWKAKQTVLQENAPGGRACQNWLLCLLSSRSHSRSKTTFCCTRSAFSRITRICRNATLKRPRHEELNSRVKRLPW